MLIFCIMMTLTTIAGLVQNVLSLSIFKIFGTIFDILILVGLWVIWITCKKNKLSSAGVKLIKVPFTIVFVFYVIGSIFEWIAELLTFQYFSFIISLTTFIIRSIYYNSIKKLLATGVSLGQNRSVGGQAGGMAAAVMTIIFAVFSAVKSIIDQIFSLSGIFMSFIMKALPEFGGNDMSIFFGGAMTTFAMLPYIIIALNFIMSIYAAILIIQFNKKMQ